MKNATLKGAAMQDIISAQMIQLSVIKMGVHPLISTVLALCAVLIHSRRLHLHPQLLPLHLSFHSLHRLLRPLM